MQNSPELNIKEAQDLAHITLWTMTREEAVQEYSDDLLKYTKLAHTYIAKMSSAASDSEWLNALRCYDHYLRLYTSAAAVLYYLSNPE